MISVPGRAVSRWGELRDGYGTDGGTGAFAAMELHDEDTDPVAYDRATMDFEAQYVLADVNATPATTWSCSPTVPATVAFR